MTIDNTGHSSFKIGKLTKGCIDCVEGRKMVLFITGICPRKCWYCPVSDNKIGHDVIYANERKISSVSEAIEEAKLCDSIGAGITGGDPLAKLDRTIEYIKALKKEFKKFHIHLYTSFDLVTEEKLKELFNSGLDEIRFHPEFEDKRLWDKIEIAKKFSWKVGIEIPCIPDKKKETYDLIEYFKDKVDFINLNELEAADAIHNDVFARGYKVKDQLSYGIEGSSEFGMEILEKYNGTGNNIHFCTSRLKNSEQLGNRIKLRAQKIKKHYDQLTEEGSLIRGAIYTEKPSFGYREKLVEISKNKSEEIRKLKKLKDSLATTLRVAKKDLDIDEIKFRILTSSKVVMNNKDKLKELGLVPAIVEEMATADLFEIELDFL